MAKKNSPFQLLEHRIEPGSRCQFEMPTARLYNQSPLSISVEVLHGKHAGPVLLLNAAIHGDELNGVEIVRQMCQTIDPARLRGTIIAVPVVNVFGFIHKSRYLPDRRDLNRCFPGSESGSLGSRIAHSFFNQIAKRCDYIIDLHTGAIHRTNLPQIRANLDNPETLRIAKAFNTPVIVDAPLRDGSLRSEAEYLGIPTLTYEAGEALRFEPISITAGVIGIKQVMRAIGMLRASRKALPDPVVANTTSWIRANANGILHCQVSLGDKVTKGQVLGFVRSPAGNEESEILSPKDGIVIGQQTLPLVNEGEAVFHLAYFGSKTVQAEQSVERYIDEVNELDSAVLTTASPL